MKTSAFTILEIAGDQIEDRAAERDIHAERSMKRTVAIFNAYSEHKLTEEEGWMFMVCVKMARSRGEKTNIDHYVDGAALFGLAGESIDFPPPIALVDDDNDEEEVEIVFEPAVEPETPPCPHNLMIPPNPPEFLKDVSICIDCGALFDTKTNEPLGFLSAEDDELVITSKPAATNPFDSLVVAEALPERKSWQTTSHPSMASTSGVKSSGKNGSFSQRSDKKKGQQSAGNTISRSHQVQKNSGAASPNSTQATTASSPAKPAASPSSTLTLPSTKTSGQSPASRGSGSSTQKPPVAGVTTTSNGKKDIGAG